MGPKLAPKLNGAVLSAKRFAEMVRRLYAAALALWAQGWRRN
jgi:hypothetical protein